MVEISIPWLRYRVEIEVEHSLMIFDALRKGYHLRTMLEVVMKRQFPCKEQDDCRTCDKVNDGCEYPMLFMPQIYSKNASSKFIILPPLGNRLIFRQGEFLSFEIRLFGNIAKDRIFTGRLLPAIEYAGNFTGLGKWRTYKSDSYGRFRIKNIFVWDKNTWQKKSTANPVQKQLNYHPENIYDGGLSEIIFISPALLRRNKKPIPNPDFFDIIKSAERRIQSLMEINERLTSDEVIKSVETISSSFKTFQIDSSRKNETFIIGNMKISHIPDELKTLIGYAGLTHIGKGVSMGMGGFILRKFLTDGNAVK